MKIAILIIAAGSSSRLGQIKQLLPYKNTVLLDYVIRECVDSQIADVFVVLGANKSRIEQHISSNCSILYHTKWAEGMGTSIAFGVREISGRGYEGVFIVLGDQPYFSGTILNSMIQKQQSTQASIVLSKYAKGMGPPVFFEQSHFEELSHLMGDMGAKPIIKKYLKAVQTIPFEKGDIDIDTIADLKYLS